MKDLISVLVPVYNVDKYLDRCITSILKQTYEKLEVVLIDDGSTDTSGVICDKYAQRDSRVKVVHQQNKGIAVTRNVAIEVSTGKYVAFIDSDDYVADDYIEYLYTLLIENEADFSCCSELYFKEGLIPQIKKNDPSVHVMDVETALSEMLYDRMYSNSSWGKLIRRDVVKGITFPVGKVFEDMYTIYKYILASNKVVYGNQKKYYYMKRAGSIMDVTKGHERLLVIDAEQDLITFLKNSNYSRALQAAYSKLFASSVICLANLSKCNEDEQGKDDQKMLWDNIIHLRGKILRNKQTKLKYRLMAMGAYLGRDSLIKIYYKMAK